MKTMFSIENFRADGTSVESLSLHQIEIVKDSLAESFCYNFAMHDYYEVLISAEDQQQADAILNILLEKKLATGGQFIQSNARFLWKNSIEDMSYITITSLTTGSKKKQLIEAVEMISQEEVPMIRLIPIEINTKLAAWIDETLR